MNYKPATLKVVKGGGKGTSQMLNDFLRNLRARYGASSLKLSTEDAAMSLDQIRYWIGLCKGTLPVIVKIGGPNARNDIKKLVLAGVDGLIAPMVESPYGLENFIAAVRDYTTPLQFDRLKKHINIETVTAVQGLDSILASPEAKFIDEITIGCSDLSKSMNMTPSHPGLRAVVKEVVARIRSRNISVSVGGGITPQSINEFLAMVRPDKFNTRVVTFDVESGTGYQTAVKEALQFEILMLEHDHSQGFLSIEEERHRTSELRKRLESVSG